MSSHEKSSSSRISWIACTRFNSTVALTREDTHRTKLVLDFAG